MNVRRRPRRGGRDVVLITCEHGGNDVPARYRPLFRGHREMLVSHRGYDPGALEMARRLARGFAAHLVVSRVSRLLVDLNRSIGHPALFSRATRDAPRHVRDEIVARHYLPYRDRVAAFVREGIAAGARVVHVSSHSFVGRLDGRTRNADVGLLYDPSRPGERALCHAWQRRLRALVPELRVRRNYPYQGRSDGFTAWFRRHFGAQAYVGIELELNQSSMLGEGARRARSLVIRALREAVAGT